VPSPPSPCPPAGPALPPSSATACADESHGPSNSSRVQPTEINSARLPPSSQKTPPRNGEEIKTAKRPLSSTASTISATAQDTTAGSDAESDIISISEMESQNEGTTSRKPTNPPKKKRTKGSSRSDDFNWTLTQNVFDNLHHQFPLTFSQFRNLLDRIAGNSKDVFPIVSEFSQDFPATAAMLQDFTFPSLAAV